MSALIDPGAIWQFTGDINQLESDITDLKSDAAAITKSGGDIHSGFQGLSAFYTAPEADQLFATTKPVADTAKTFGDELQKVAEALSAYAGEVRPIAQKLSDLRDDATKFVADAKKDHDWQYDSHKVDRNNDLRHQVDAAVAAFWDAEIRCANKIEAIFGGTRFVHNDGSNKSNMYGYTADQLDHAKGLPWGDAVEQKHHAWEVWYWAKSFVWDGLIVDGLWGTIKGLGNLVGFGGWDAFVNSWKGLGELGIGLVSYSIPFGTAIPDSWLPGWVQESRKTTREFGKSLVAWDEWGKNPARAAGGTVFNALTFLAGGEGAAAKAGTVGKVASALSKAGKFIDPMAYVAKGASLAFKGIGQIPKVAAALDALKNLKDGAIVHMKGLVNLDALRARFGRLPDGSVKLPDGAGFFDRQGNYHLPNGEINKPPVELSAADRAQLHPDSPSPLHAQAPAEPELVGAHVGGGSHDLASVGGEHGGPHGGGEVRHDGGGVHEPPNAVGRTDHQVHNSAGGGHQPSNAATQANHGAHSSPNSGHATSGAGAAHHTPPQHGQVPPGSGSHGHPPTAHNAPHGGPGDGPQPSGHIPEHTVHHVLEGEIKYGKDGRPKVVGYHYRPGGIDRPGVKVPKILERDHRTGLTLGNVWMRDPRTGEWIMKRAKTTFFPPDWSERDVRRAMTKAYENASVKDPDLCMWEGSYKGIQFEGYFDPVTGDAKTAYPIMPKK